MYNNLSDIANHILAITELTSVNLFDFIGKGNEKQADQIAVTSMRDALNQLNIDGKIIIGEGERDDAPMLYIGEKLGKGGYAIDIAVDPLEGTTICADAGEGSLAVIAIAEKNNLLHAPDLYMEKIAIGNNLPQNIIDLDFSIEQNISNLAKAKNKQISDIKVIILKRDRHNDIIKKLRELNVSIKLISDGDISAIIDVAMDKADIYLGSGGAPEGVLAASALKTIGGQMMTRLISKNDNDLARAKKMGITDINKKYLINDMVKSEVIFIASAITNSNLLQGVRKESNKITINSLMMNSLTKEIKNITTIKLI